MGVDQNRKITTPTKITTTDKTSTMTMTTTLTKMASYAEVQVEFERLQDHVHRIQSYQHHETSLGYVNFARIKIITKL